MSDIVPLGEVVNFRNDLRTPISKVDRIPGKYPYFGASGIIDWIDSFNVDGCFLTVGEDGAVVDDDGAPRVSVIKGKASVNNHAHLLEVKDTSEVDPIYLCYALKSRDVSSLATGIDGKFSKLKKSVLAKVEVPIPTLDRQREIVSRMQEVEHLLNNLLEEFDLRKKIVQAQVDEALGGLAGNSVTIGDVASFRRGVQFSRSQVVGDNEGVRVITAKEVNWDTRTIATLQSERIAVSQDCFAKFALQAGDTLLCAASGSLEHLGKSVFVKSNKPLIYGSFLGRLRPDVDLIDPYFLFLVTQSSRFTDYLAAQTPTGVISSLTKKQVESYQFVLSDIDVQREVASTFKDHYFLLYAIFHEIEKTRKGNREILRMLIP